MKKPGPKAKRYEFNGQQMSLVEIAKLTGFTAKGVKYRIDNGKPLVGKEEADAATKEAKAKMWKDKGRSDRMKNERSTNAVELRAKYIASIAEERTKPGYIVPWEAEMAAAFDYGHTLGLFGQVKQESST